MIDITKFILKPEYFDFPESPIHGISHTYRVMTLVWILGEKTNLPEIREIAFMAAFLHDMARKHDGYCPQHGKMAVKYKLPLFADLFRQEGATDETLKKIAFSVHFHSMYFQPVRHPYYKVLALLKDADALDRIRICKNDLNPRMLRFKESIELIPFAEQLYYHSLQLANFDIVTLMKLIGEI